MKNKWSAFGVAFLLAVLAVLAARGWAAPQEAKLPPLEITREGYLFAGGKYTSIKDARAMSGQMYAEYQIPAHQRHPYPIVFVHGGNQTGSNFTGTPDGREGWAQFFLREGYAVYVVDQAGRGRSAYRNELDGPQSAPNLEDVQRRFTAIENYNLWPQAHLHTQWPGKGVAGDPVFDQFFASQVPGIASYATQQQLSTEGLIALIDKIGPAIVLTHSQSGGMGWPLADARPEQVKAIIAVEPSGPPFRNVDNVPAPEWFRDAAEVQRPWGPTALPLTYSPAAASPSDLEMERQEQPENPNVSRCWLQKSPARQLPNLQRMPILVVTSESSYHRAYDHCTVKYLEQAGVHVSWVKLDEVGLHGNGHMMMLEKNNGEIARVMAGWLDRSVPATGKPKAAKAD